MHGLIFFWNSNNSGLAKHPTRIPHRFPGLQPRLSSLGGLQEDPGRPSETALGCSAVDLRHRLHHDGLGIHQGHTRLGQPSPQQHQKTMLQNTDFQQLDGPEAGPHLRGHCHGFEEKVGFVVTCPAYLCMHAIFINFFFFPFSRQIWNNGERLGRSHPLHQVYRPTNQEW